MFTELEDLKRLHNVTCSSKETPLNDLVGTLQSNPTRYVLKRSTLQQSHWLIWDTLTKEYAVFTHAFAVRQALHPGTGNFVPTGQTPPEGLLESQIKAEPGPYAQLSLTLDARLDESLHGKLSVIETWAKADTGFVTTGRARNPWMSPVSISNNGRYVVTSSLFIGKTAFNSKEDGIVTKYKVHPWVAKASASEPMWIPNPNLVRILHLNDDRTLVELTESTNPLLHLGDIVKMTFKFIFTSYGQYWNMSCCPIQIIRLGQLDKSVYGFIHNPEDHGRLELPKAGEKLVEFFNAPPCMPSGINGFNIASAVDHLKVLPAIINLSAKALVSLSGVDDTPKEYTASLGSLTPLSGSLSISDWEDSTKGEEDSDLLTPNTDSIVNGILIASGDDDADSSPNAEDGGKPMHSGETDPPAISKQVTAVRGKKRSSSGLTSMKTRTVKPRTAL